MIRRAKTKPVRVGSVTIGGDAPIAIQSMTNTYTEDVINTVLQIEKLANAGCEIVRLAVPTSEAATAIKQIKQQIRIPLVADIHFDYRLAIQAIEAGVDKVRINPGNIGSEARVREVVAALKERQIPLRIGVNSGSVERSLLNAYGGPKPAAMVESALRHIALVEANNYDNIVVSIKSSSVADTIEAYELLTTKVNYPLHLGVTEVGTQFQASIKSAMGIGPLLMRGIGDTVRVSVTGDPVSEVPIAKAILNAAGVRQFGINIIACPTCGRCNIDLERIVNQIETHFSSIDKPLTLAIMGCAVNGPGEAKEADLGIAGGKDSALLFKHGKPLYKVPYDQIIPTLTQLINQWSS